MWGRYNLTGSLPFCNQSQGALILSYCSAGYATSYARCCQSLWLPWSLEHWGILAGDEHTARKSKHFDCGLVSVGLWRASLLRSLQISMIRWAWYRSFHQLLLSFRTPHLLWCHSSKGRPGRIWKNPTGTASWTSLHSLCNASPSPQPSATETVLSTMLQPALVSHSLCFDTTKVQGRTSYFSPSAKSGAEILHLQQVAKDYKDWTCSKMHKARCLLASTEFAK